jgi:hypothetical protein
MTLLEFAEYIPGFLVNWQGIRELEKATKKVIDVPYFNE